jgi:dethiobiotin synthetase
VPTLADLLHEVRWPYPEVDVAWLETVGGPRSPIGSDGDAVDLVAAVRPREVVLVADAGLGTINAVRLSVAPFRDLGHEPIVLLNRFDSDDDLHRRNAAWLHDLGIAAVLSPGAVVDLLDRISD